MKGAGLVMKALIEEGEPEIGVKMQQLALAEGTKNLVLNFHCIGLKGCWPDI